MRYIPHEYQRFGEEAIISHTHLGLFWEMGLGSARRW